MSASLPELPKPIRSSKHWDDRINRPFAAERAARLEREDQLRSAHERIAALDAQVAAYNTNGFADADAMASAYLDMRARAESAEVNLENARKANRTWRCFHCDFTTSNGDEALAHFGERDDAEEFTPLCKWWSNMDDQERKEQFQALIMELNGERESNNTAALEAQLAEAQSNYQTLLDDAVEMREKNRTLREALTGLLARHTDGCEEQYWAEWDTALDAMEEKK